jgi:uncharacterized protein YpmB
MNILRIVHGILLIMLGILFLLQIRMTNQFRKNADDAIDVARRATELAERANTTSRTFSDENEKLLIDLDKCVRLHQ